MAEDGQPGAGHPEREPDADLQDVRAQREAALLAEHAHGLITAAGGEERTLAGLAGQPRHDRARLIGHVVVLSRTDTEQIQLGSE